MQPQNEGLERDVDRALLKATVAGRLFGRSASPIQLGRFRLLGRLGHGATGVVYDALDTERDTRVALKVMSESDGRAIYHLKREFRALADVVHPNLVRLHELLHEGSLWFFTMELIDPGIRFDRFCRDVSRGVDPDHLRAALRQLATAVRVIHGAGKLHCDLKSSNVLVTQSGRVVVLDFGLVDDAESRISLRSALLGTPAYVAPEQVRGAAPTQASDWYAFGVMLFEALTGELPFTGGERQVLAAKQTQAAPDPQSLAESAPADLCALCRGLLVTDPKLRFGADHVSEALRDDPGSSLEPSGAVFASTRQLFVGRTRELAALLDAWDETRRGASLSVFVAGPSGMGKSALLDRFVEIASETGLVLRGRCREAESVPYKALDWVVDGLSAFLRGLPEAAQRGLLPRNAHALLQAFPVLGQVPTFSAAAAAASGAMDPRTLRNQGFAALKELLQRLTDKGPVALVVDDLHWGDLDSARLLEFVLGAPEPSRLLFAGAYRDNEVERSDFLAQLLGSQAGDGALVVRTVALGPLQPEAATELVVQLLGVHHDFADAIATEAEGVPFFIAQLAQASRLRASGASPLKEVIGKRVDALPIDAQRLLQVLSIAMGPLEQEVALAAAELRAGDREALHTLYAERMIRTRGAPGDSLETYHDRIREAIAGRLMPELRVALHARIARALEAHGIADAERFIVHYLGAGERVRAGRSALEAARSARRKLAFNRAAALFAQAIELLPASEVRANSLHKEHAAALADAGRGLPAATAYLAAAEGLQPSDARHMRRMAARQYLRSGRSVEGLTLLRSILSDVGVWLPQGRVAMALCLLQGRALLRIRGVEPRRTRKRLSAREVERLETLSDLYPELLLIEPLGGAMLHNVCLRQSLDAGDLDRCLDGLAYEVVNTAYIGGPRNEQRAATIMLAVNALAARVDTPHGRGMAHFAQGLLLWCGGRRSRDAAIEVRAALDEFSRCSGAFWQRAVAAFTLLACLESTVDLSELARLSQALLDEATERDDRFGAMLTTDAVTYARLMADDPAGAQQVLDRHHAWTPSGVYTNSRFLWMLRAIETQCYAGTPEAGMVLAASEWAAYRRSALWPSRVMRSTAVFFIARCAAACYAKSRTPQDCARARSWLRKFEREGDNLRPFVAALHAALHIKAGQRGEAIAALQRCEAEFDARQSRLGQYAKRIVCELQGERETAEQIDAWLRAQGVVNPVRWVGNHFSIQIDALHP